MRQVTQTLSDGKVTVLEVPEPVLTPHSVLVRTARSLVSVGTERSKVELGRMSLVEKARRRPADVKKVLDRVRREGILDTYHMVKGRLEQPSPLGYSASGVVMAVGELVEGIRPGDRVACGGAGYANHAEVISVPGNLCARIPEGLTFESASYATIGAIALQGFRQSGLGVGDSVCVTGLGLLGLITVQIAKAAGCRVFGYDPDPHKERLALTLGADLVSESCDESGLVVRAHDVSGGRGVDAVIITASTRSSDPVRVAGILARDRGVVVVVGDVGMDIPRAEFYEKELSLRLSRSYGPGRYDPLYEEFGIDYPVGYVKWTERRNMEEFLRLAASGAIHTDLLTTQRYSLERAPAAYDMILAPTDPVIGVILEYPDTPDVPAEKPVVTSPPVQVDGLLGIGLVGAGNFATGTLLPALSATGEVRFAAVATATGLRATDTAARFGFGRAAADTEDILADESVSALVVATRHDSHAALVAEALRAGKHVFVEKPLALSTEELKGVVEAHGGSDRVVAVGFNRRYSPAARAVRAGVRSLAAPVAVVIRVNAGEIPDDHWIQRLEQGGGRIVGEVCHFVDLAMYLTGGIPTFVQASHLGNDRSAALQDCLTAAITFDNGGMASITYLSNGDSGIPKERVEVFCGGTTHIIDDFRTVLTSVGGRVSKDESRRVDKGHAAEMAEFVRACKGQESSVPPFADAVRASAATLAIVKALAEGGTVPVVSPT